MSPSVSSPSSLVSEVTAPLGVVAVTTAEFAINAAPSDVALIVAEVT